jgi:hypothetical protein
LALGSNHPDVANVLVRLASCYLAIGKVGEIAAIIERATSIAEQTTPPNHSAIWNLRTIFAMLK